MRRAVVVSIVILILASAQVAAEQIKAGVLPFFGSATIEHRVVADAALLELLRDLDRFAIHTYSGYSGWCCRFVPGTDEEMAAVGQALQVDVVFAGRIDELDADWEKAKGKDERDHWEASARITIAVAAADTGQVLGIIHSTGTAEHNHYAGTAMAAALRKCFDTEVEVRLREIFALNSTVTAVDDRNVTFDIGRSVGVQTSTRFNVIRLTDTSEDSTDEPKHLHIGLVEATHVDNTTGEGHVVWADLPLLPGDHLQEEARPDKRYGGLDLTLVPYQLQSATGASRFGVAPTLRGYGGGERPFCCSWGFVIEGPVFADAVTLISFGGFFGLEAELQPGRQYLQGPLAIGALTGSQRATLPWGRTTNVTGSTFYLAATAGYKYYIFRNAGLRFETGAGLQLGPAITKWKYTDSDKREYDYSAYVAYKQATMNGLRLFAGFSLGF